MVISIHAQVICFYNHDLRDYTTNSHFVPTFGVKRKGISAAVKTGSGRTGLLALPKDIACSSRSLRDRHVSRTRVL